MAQRVYLVIMDQTEESRLALRFASRRAVRTDGVVHIVAIVPQQTFSAFAAVQATIEDEARSRAEVLVTAAAGSLVSEGGAMPVVSVREGEHVIVVRDYLTEHPEVSALVLGAASDGNPGPLVSHFAVVHPGQLPCPLMIGPGSMHDEDVDRLS